MEQMTQIMDELTQEIIALGNTVLVMALVIAFIPYILFGIGLSNVAQRCRLRNQWMAWVPIARKHLLAEIADLRRAQVRKKKKLATQFEVISYLGLACIYGISRENNTVFLILGIVISVLYIYNQVFCYYYFYRLCDQENATIYFILGTISAPLNPIFVYHCR